VVEYVSNILTLAMGDNRRAISAQGAAGTISVVSDVLPTSTGEPSVVFLDKHINSVHPKLKLLQPTYSNEEGKFIEPGRQALVAIQETSEMRRQKELFLTTVTKFESSGKGVKSKVRLDSSTVHQWEDVIAELNNIQNGYNNVKQKGMLGNIRDVLRRFKKYRSPCEQWLKVLTLPSAPANSCVQPLADSRTHAAVATSRFVARLLNLWRHKDGPNCQHACLNHGTAILPLIPDTRPRRLWISCARRSQYLSSVFRLRSRLSSEYLELTTPMQCSLMSRSFLWRSSICYRNVSFG
jgi:hypothetical protein